jgi:Ca2+:H+ antiporter
MGSPRQRLLLALILAVTVAAGAADLAGAPHVLTFIVSGVALGGLAWVVSAATEAVGTRFGPAVTGVLQASLGNLPELFVVLFALRAGEVVVAETSILGSIFANALLVMGFVILAGVRQAPDGIMRFHRRLPQDTGTLLLIAVFIIVLLGLSVGSADPASGHRQAISNIGAVLLIAVYVIWLVGYLRGDTAASGSEDEHGGGGFTFPVALTLLAAGGVAAAFVSDWFVTALVPSLETLHLSEAFAGIVIVAIAGNAVEHVAGIVLASKGKSDLAVSVVKNSVSQIALFLYPALVLLSLLLDTHLTFVLAPVYIGALGITALALWQITEDGEAVAFEGWGLVSLYVIVAVFAYFE